MESLPANSTATALQDQNASVRRELQTAAREIRDQIRREVHQQMQRRADRAATTQAPGAPAGPPPGEPPLPPGVVITQSPGQHPIIVSGTEVPFDPNAIPPQAVDISLAFFFTVAAIVIGLPISRAFARRMDRKAGPSQIAPEVSAQLGQLAQAVDAIALEVERISEGQRFTTRLLTEQRDAARHTLPAGSDR